MRRASRGEAPLPRPSSTATASSAVPTHVHTPWPRPCMPVMRQRCILLVHAGEEGREGEGEGECEGKSEAEGRGARERESERQGGREGTQQRGCACSHTHPEHPQSQSPPHHLPSRRLPQVIMPPPRLTSWLGIDPKQNRHHPKVEQELRGSCTTHQPLTSKTTTSSQLVW